MTSNLVRCPKCSTMNRVPILAPGKRARCGRCATVFTPGAELFEVFKELFGGFFK